jgi:hypothetical protein
VLTIVAFGILTLALHEELVRGDRAALGLAAFIGVYWGARIAVDLAWFSHSDWPAGRQFVVGHALLLALFLFLAGTYLGLVAWHLARQRAASPGSAEPRGRSPAHVEAEMADLPVPHAVLLALEAQDAAAARLGE